MNSLDLDLINRLASRTIESLDKSNHDIERTCWQIVHEYDHGLMPFEYDVREIDETLYLSVLKEIKQRLKGWIYFDYIIKWIELITKTTICRYALTDKGNFYD